MEENFSHVYQIKSFCKDFPGSPHVLAEEIIFASTLNFHNSKSRLDWAPFCSTFDDLDKSSASSQRPVDRRSSRGASINNPTKGQLRRFGSALHKICFFAPRAFIDSRRKVISIQFGADCE